MLSKNVDVVGSPEVRLQVQAPTAKATQSQDAGKLVLYLKVADVAPGGTAKVVRNLAAPVRVPDVDRPFTVTMPAFVHRFAKGHKIRLLVAGASPNYRGNNAPVGVGITTTAVGGTARTLPVQSMTLPSIQRAPDSNGGAPNNSAPGENGGGAGTPSAAGSDNGNDNDKGNDKSTSGDTAQAAPPVANASSATTTPLPDTGGPQLGLLAAGLLLVLLGAHLLMRRRPDSLS